MDKQRLVVWFSCGAASAVTAKICLSLYAEKYDICIARFFVANEHSDNDRFAADCERWLQHPIVTLRNDEYADCWEVWEKAQYLTNSRGGSPCTAFMKKSVRYKFEDEWKPDFQAFGYTLEETKRADIFRRNNPEVTLLTPLIDKYLSKKDCLSLIEQAGIDLPMMYRLGFNNNNCIGCVKGGMGYWNRIRVYFPDVYDRMAKLERKYGYALFREKGDPLYLDELPPNAGRHKEPEIDCSLFCYRANQMFNTQEANHG